MRKVHCWNASKVFAVLLCLGVCAQAAFAASGEAEQRVEEGRAHYEAADYAAAADAFTEADAALPGDPRILFDLGAALAARGDVEQAEALLQKAAASDDRGAAIRARYNLGCLAAEKARALFGNRPEEASPEMRQQGIELLDQAAGHYRECLRLDENHADARHNLELLRLWTAGMRNTWRARDQQKQASPTTPDKPSPKKTASQGDSSKGPSDDNKTPGKAKKEGKDDKGQPADTGEGTRREGKPPPSKSGEREAPQDQAEKLLSKVRQRSQEKREWDKQHLSSRSEGPEEKDW